jgi:CHAT domain-containing protein
MHCFSGFNLKALTTRVNGAAVVLICATVIPVTDATAQAASSGPSVSDPTGLKHANQLNAEALRLQREGKLAEALAPAREGLKMVEDLLGPDHLTTGIFLTNLALLLQASGEYAPALPMFQRALAITEKAKGPDHPDTGVRLNNLAELYRLLGDYGKALSLAQRALAIAEKELGPEHERTGIRLNNLALLFRMTGDFGTALPLYQRSLALAEKTLGPEHPSTSVRLANLASLYRAMGDYQRALPLYERALAIAEKVHGPEHATTGARLNDMALICKSMGDYRRALPLFERSLAIAEKTQGPEHPGTAVRLSNLAGLYRLMGEPARALPLAERSLAINLKSRGPDHPEVATGLTNQALLHEALGHPALATPLHERALAIASQIGNPGLVWTIAGNLRSHHAPRQPFPGYPRNLPLAIYYGKLSINALQQVRGNLQSADSELQQSFINKVSGYYTRLAELLIESERIDEAEQVLAMLKERELSDVVRRANPPKTQAIYAGSESVANAEGAALSERGVRDSAELAALELKLRNKIDLTSTEESRRQTLLKNAEQWRTDYQRWITSLAGRIVGAERSEQEAKRLAAASGVQGGRLQTLVRADPGAVGLHYVVTDDSIAIIVATARGSFGRSSAIKRSELNQQIAALRLAIQARRDPKPAAQALYKMLIAPVAADLADAKAQTLVLSLTETLRYLPFAALHDGNSYLIERYALVNHASAGNTQAKTGGAPWQVAALGVTQAATVAGQSFTALPGVQGELDSIVKSATKPGAGILPGQVSLDAAFDRKRFEAALNGPYSVVHVASHFAFMPGNETRSVLLLGAGQTLSLAEIAVMDFNQVDQLTLSACDTATGGGINENGAEVEGLAAAVQLQGAKAVLASLWPVADGSTASLMRGFYGARANDNTLSRAKALQQAQLALLRGAAAGAGSTNDQRGARIAGAEPQAGAMPTDPAKPWAHPYFWAAFVLSGNWL